MYGDVKHSPALLLLSPLKGDNKSRAGEGQSCGLIIVSNTSLLETYFGESHNGYQLTPALICYPPIKGGKQNRAGQGQTNWASRDFFYIYPLCTFR